jgi:STE24 endopeptidase
MEEAEPSTGFYQYDENKRILARRYENLKLLLDSVAGTIVPISASIFLVFSAFSIRLSQVSLSITNSYWLSAASYLLFFIVFLQVVETPILFYSGFIVDHKFGLSTQGLKDWFVDEMKSLGVELVFGILGGLVLYYLIRTTNLWWLAAAALFALFSILLSVLVPYVIMPIFYKVTPLANPALKDDLLEMSRKVGRKSIDRVLVADESRKSIRANAMFSGIGKSRAVILFDTLINNFTRREVATVVAHELGHYANKDIWKSALVSGLLAIPPFFIADYALRSSAAGLGLVGVADPAGFPIILGILIGASFLMQPISNWVSRVLERQADEFALRASEDPDAQASAEKRLADLSLAVDAPHPIVELFFYSHPSSSRRVRLAEDWKRTHSGPSTVPA